MTDVPIGQVYFDSEPDIPILGGPLCRGYGEFIAGRPERCCEIIAEFLASVYASRPKEFSTERFVVEICRERGLPLPSSRAAADPSIVRAAAERRYSRLHRPLIENILAHGYLPGLGPPITMREQRGRYFVGDGKNRCSILAALGEKTVPDAEVRRVP